MRPRYRLFRRAGGTFYTVDNRSQRQQTLGTKDKREALRLLHAKNEADAQPGINLQIARIYLMASDPAAATRTWQQVMDEMAQCKRGATRERWERAVREKPFDRIRRLPILETRAECFLAMLSKGTVSTNIYLRRLHNFALDMSWLPAPVIPRRKWPPIEFRPRRGITIQEHERILAGERNPEWRAYYELLWQLGGSQTDIATLEAADIDWTFGTVCYRRQKTGSPVVQRLGPSALKVLAALPRTGPLFPMLASWPETDRAKAFIRRCRRVGVQGVSLHSYRYAWAERARTCGYPERYAQEALGHNSAAVHRAYAKRAHVLVPSLEQYEEQARGPAGGAPVVPLVSSEGLGRQSGESAPGSEAAPATSAGEGQEPGFRVLPGPEAVAA